ncbi:MAG: hypothetical protein J6Q13_03245 [Clostridia bacterium]|nr:hypothetical protein [Clostridia bacterium]
MVKKKFSGQTIAIIILAIMLILAIGFGGVYAFYTARSNQVIGKVQLATLSIRLDPTNDPEGSTESEESQIAISNYVNVVPGQALENTPLKVLNESESINIYLAVVYKIDATVEETKDGQKVTRVIEDKFEESVLGLGYEYINSIHPEKSSKKWLEYETWVDYVFDAPEEDTQYRVLVSMQAFEPTVFDKEGKPIEKQITVIAENQLSLSGAMGDDYQGASISFTFQAFAIPEASFNNPNNENSYISSSTTKADKAEIITRGIYESRGCKFIT